jgi:hypothetical protein
VSALAIAMRELFDAGHRGEGGGEVLELRRAAENAVGDLRPGRGGDG